MVFYRSQVALSFICQLSPIDLGGYLIPERGILLPVDVFTCFYMWLTFTSV